MKDILKDDVINSINTVISQLFDSAVGFRIIGDYDVDNVSKKVTRIVLSYIDYINRTVWSKGL